MRNFVGRQIDRYKIISQVGLGGMAVVYRAYDLRLERDVALKLIRTEAIPSEQHAQLLKRFEREAKSQARLSHPNLIPVFDYGDIDGSPYLVMKYFPGGTLKDRLKGPISYDQAIRLLLPITDALRYAHGQNIVHRDIKPTNILFDDEDRPILTDFGIAKVLETDGLTLTGTGLGVGTPGYMAPEQWQGKACAASDQYALGVLLYEMLTGQKPYQADTPVAVALKQMNEPVPSLSDFVPGIPASLEAFIHKAMAINPEDRFKNLWQFQQTLYAIAGEAQIAYRASASNAQQDQKQKYGSGFTISESPTIDEINYGNLHSPDRGEKPVQAGRINPNSPEVRMRRGVMWFGGGVVLALLLIFGTLFVLQARNTRKAIMAETQNAVALAAFSTLTAESITDTPTVTLTFTSTVTNTATPTRTDTPTPSMTPSPLPTATEKMDLEAEIRSSIAYLRAGPHLNHPIISGGLRKGVDVKLLSTDRYADWFYVETVRTGERGWLLEDWLYLPQSIRSLKVASNIPTTPPNPNQPEPTNPPRNKYP